MILSKSLLLKKHFGFGIKEMMTISDLERNETAYFEMLADTYCWMHINCGYNILLEQTTPAFDDMKEWIRNTVEQNVNRSYKYYKIVREIIIRDHKNKKTKPTLSLYYSKKNLECLIDLMVSVAI